MTADQDFLVPTDWVAWEQREAAWAKRAPWSIKNGILWRREVLAAGVGKAADPAARGFLEHGLHILEHIAEDHGIEVTC